jgi:hypothetical protein
LPYSQETNTGSPSDPDKFSPHPEYYLRFILIQVYYELFGRQSILFQINVKLLENSMESRKVYLEKLYMCSISYTADTSPIFELFPRMPQLVHLHWLWPVKFAVEGVMALEVGMPGPAYIPIVKE